MLTILKSMCTTVNINQDNFQKKDAKLFQKW